VITERIVTSDYERKLFIKFVENHKLPFTARLEPGRHRSIEQNKTQYMWFREVSDQTGHDAEEIRAICKLKFGLPILMRDSEKMAALYGAVLSDKTYREKIMLMTEPVCLPVTSLMKTDQMKEYMDTLWQYFTEERGFDLTQPAEKW
jgi:hypothetical protein